MQPHALANLGAGLLRQRRGRIRIETGGHAPAACLCRPLAAGGQLRLGRQSLIGKAREPHQEHGQAVGLLRHIALALQTGRHGAGGGRRKPENRIHRSLQPCRIGQAVRIRLQALQGLHQLLSGRRKRSRVQLAGTGHERRQHRARLRRFGKRRLQRLRVQRPRGLACRRQGPRPARQCLKLRLRLRTGQGRPRKRGT